MLILLEERISGLVRERIVVSYLRYVGLGESEVCRCVFFVFQLGLSGAPAHRRRATLGL